MRVLRLLLVFTLWPCAAGASPGGVDLAVLPIEPPLTDELVNELLEDAVASAANGAFEGSIVGPAEVRDRLSQQGAGRLRRCKVPRCVARAASELDARVALWTRALRSGDQLVLSFKLVDVENRRIVARHQMAIASDVQGFAQACQTALAGVASKQEGVLVPRQAESAPAPPDATASTSLAPAGAQGAFNTHSASLSSPRPPPLEGRFTPRTKAATLVEQAPLTQVNDVHWHPGLGFVDNDPPAATQRSLDEGEAPKAQVGLNVPSLVSPSAIDGAFYVLGGTQKVDALLASGENEPDGGWGAGYGVQLAWHGPTQRVGPWLRAEVLIGASKHEEGKLAATGQRYGFSSDVTEAYDELFLVNLPVLFGVDFYPISNSIYRSVLGVGVLGGAELNVVSGSTSNLDEDEKPSSVNVGMIYGLHARLQTPVFFAEVPTAYVDLGLSWHRAGYSNPAGGDGDDGTLTARYRWIELGVNLGTTLGARLFGRYQKRADFEDIESRYAALVPAHHAASRFTGGIGLAF